MKLAYDANVESLIPAKHDRALEVRAHRHASACTHLLLLWELQRTAHLNAPPRNAGVLRGVLLWR